MPPATTLLLCACATASALQVGQPTLRFPATHRRVTPPPLLVSTETPLRESNVRAGLLAGASCLSLVATLPPQADFWRLDDASSLLSNLTPLGTLFGVGALVVAAWTAFSTELHPITAKARGIEPAPAALTFQLLGLSGVLLASAAIAFSWYPLPIAGSAVELAHCALPFALWQIDVLLWRWMMPDVDWDEDATSLPANYAAEHDAILGAVLAWAGVCWFEVYVQQLVASPLTLAGWPLLGSASLIALNAGLFNHRLANGKENGVACMEFYWTVSLMFGLSNSALPVGIYHHLMYSMPKFVACYDRGIEAAPNPAARALTLHGALMAWHLAVFAAVGRAGVPTALPPLPSVPEGLSLLPSSAAAGFGLVFFGLFVANTAGTIGAAMQSEEA